MTKRSNFNLAHITIAFGVIIAGLILAMIAQNIKVGFWQSAINNISSALFISGIFSIINEYLLKNQLVELILNKINLKEDINRTGIDAVYSGISEINYRTFIKKAKRNIDIVHTYGRTWTNTNIEEICERINNSNCIVRVILLSPESQFTNALAAHYCMEPEHLKQTMAEVLNTWKDTYAKIGNKKKKNLRLYYHTGQPTNAMYRIDDKIITVLTKLSKGKTKQLPTINCVETKNSDDLYNVFLREIDQLICESKEYDFKMV